MPISAMELVSGFAEAVAVGDVSVFAGAGLSQAAGLPGWAKLIRKPAAQAGVPGHVQDSPLVAQYVVNEGGEDALHDSIRRQIDIVAEPTETHHLLMRLPIRDYWTTNYDLLLETTLAQQGVPFRTLVREVDYRSGGAPEHNKKRITKMHGSIEGDEVGKRDWRARPVITRSDFERYEENHPITWTRLRAAWLSNSFLFLGLSFDDPNLNLLLRISRSLPEGVDAPPHYVVFSKKDKKAEQRLQELRIRDLEKAGLSVHLLDSREDLPMLLRQLEVRCREPMLFIAGSFKSKAGVDAALCVEIANALAPLADSEELTLASFGGAPGQVVSKQFRALISDAAYRPERVRFYFRKSEGDEEHSPVGSRVGMTVFTELELPAMRELVFSQARAMIVIGGGPRTVDEVRLAQALGVRILPVAASGGAARELWTPEAMAALDLDKEHQQWWSKLASPESGIVARATATLVQRVMYQ